MPRCVPRLLLQSAFLLLVHAAQAAPNPDSSLHQLITDYQSWQTEADPLEAAQRGNLAAAALWPDDSPAAVAARTKKLMQFAARLRAIPRNALHGEDALNAAFLDWRFTTDLRGEAFDEERIPFTNDEGFFVQPFYTATSTQLNNEAEARAWISRLHGLPRYYAQETANMRRGIKDGFTQPRLSAQTALRSTRKAADTPAESDPLLAPFDTLPATMPAATRARLRAEGLAIIRAEVKPAERALAEFFEKTYLPAARTSLGAASLPDGRAYYTYLVARETTTSLTPDQVFAIGTAEIARIRGEMETQIRATGYTGSFAAFQAMLRSDPRFYATTPEALLEKASRLAKIVDDQLPHIIGKLPRLSYGVRPVPAEIADGYTSARYFPGSPAAGLAGGLMINTSHLSQRPLYELPALVAHEGAPGHHIQIALSQELTGLASFRSDAYITAFVEGWGVYAEQLGNEIGLYRTPYDKFGALSMEMWRACRLVMDVGIHWKLYTRDQALACLRENTALSETNMQTEVDRYIAWPGQALGYKIGELKIMELRHRAEAALGAHFDERAFHDAVLDEGAMPLSVLEQRIDDWIKDARK